MAISTDDALAVSSSKSITEWWTALLLGVEVRTKSSMPPS